MIILGIIGIIFGIVLLIWLAYKGINVIVLGPLCGLVVALFCGMNLLTTFTDVIVPGISGYVQAMFGPILMGCVVAAFILSAERHSPLRMQSIGHLHTKPEKRQKMERMLF